MPLVPVTPDPALHPAPEPLTAAAGHPAMHVPREYEIDAQIDQSFPASDPPGWTMGAARLDDPPCA